MDIKVISRSVGTALLVSALFMFISMVISIANGMDTAFVPLSVSFIITFLVGLFPHIFVKRNPSISHVEGFAIIVFCWVFSFIFGMLPYLLWGGPFSVINAWYESVSGYTTTGGTILTDIEALPHSLVFWRSSTHFIGGLGIVVFLLLMMPKSSPSRLRLTNMELSSFTRTGYKSISMNVIHIMILVYVGLVIAETFFLMLAGMPFLDAVNHSFSTIATGGFSSRNASIAYYDSRLIEFIIIVFMLLSSLHLGVIFSVVSSRSLRPLRHPVVKFFFGTFAVLVAIVTVSLLSSGTYTSFKDAFLDGTFQVASQISTTGFAVADNNGWPMLACMMLLYASFQCGCSGSTNGGVKSDRMLILLKGIALQARKIMHPNYVQHVKSGNILVKDETLLQVVIFVATYTLILIISFVLLLCCGVGVAEAFSGPLTCMSNSGPGMGLIGTMGNYAALPALAKFILTLDMLVGRVEIFPLFAVFMSLPDIPWLRRFSFRKKSRD